MKKGYDHAAGEPSALCFLQCFDTVGWVTRRTQLAKQPVTFIPKGCLETSGGKTEGKLANPGLPGKTVTKAAVMSRSKPTATQYKQQSRN